MPAERVMLDSGMNVSGTCQLYQVWAYPQPVKELSSRNQVFSASRVCGGNHRLEYG